MVPAEEETLSTEEAFGLLANETRLEIIRTLGDESETGEYSPQPFSELQTAVGVEDSGQFGYHLRKLEGHFVERTDEGFLLRVPGIRVYQAIKAGAYAERDDVGPFDSDDECADCGSPLFVFYRDLRFHIRCRSCETTFLRYPIAPNSFDPDRPETLAEAGDARIKRDHAAMSLGACPYCSGRIITTLSRTSDALDDSVNEVQEVFAHRTCERCHWFLDFALGSVLFHHPTVVATFYRLGVDVSDLPLWSDEMSLDETVLSTDPWRVEARIHSHGETVRLVVDDDLNVLEMLDPADAAVVGTVEPTTT